MKKFISLLLILIFAGSAYAGQVNWKDEFQSPDSPYVHAFTGVKFERWDEYNGAVFITETRCSYKLSRDGFIHFDSIIMNPNIRYDVYEKNILPGQLVRLRKSGRVYTSLTAHNRYTFTLRDILFVKTYVDNVGKVYEHTVTRMLTPYVNDPCFTEFTEANTAHLKSQNFRMMLLDFRTNNWIIK